VDVCITNYFANAYLYYNTPQYTEHTHPHNCTHEHAHARTHTNTHTLFLYACTCVHFMHTHTHTHESTHTDTHTHTHVPNSLSLTHTPNGLSLYPKHTHTHTPTNRVAKRPTGCLIFRVHCPQKSPIISGSLAKRDLQLKTSYGSSPPYRRRRFSKTIAAAQHTLY